MSVDLDDYLREQDAIQFAWGSADCVHFAGGWVERLTGQNPLSAYSYSGESGALRLIAEAGSLRALVSLELGEPQRVLRGGTEISAGDIVLATYGSIGEIVGIAVQNCAWYRQPGRRGLFPAPFEQCLYFWRPECRKPL